jgi:DNA-binding IclR family transcriptional regulator
MLVASDKPHAPGESTISLQGVAERSQQRSIQSIEIGFQLIEVLNKAGMKLPLKQLAERASMPPAKAHLYLVSFMRVGLVVQDADTSHYGLGPYAIQIGNSALRQIQISDLARQFLTSLCEEFDMPAYLSIWGRMGPFIVSKVDAELSTPFSIRVGHVFPLLATATGRIFLAYLPSQLTDRIVLQEAELDPELGRRRDEFVKSVKAAGIAISEGYLFRGFSAVSAPVFGYGDELAGAITVLGPGVRIDRSVDGRLSVAVQSAAHEIGRRLGAADQRTQSGR